MIEMALTMPLLIMLALALVEIGIVFANYIALVNAAHEGAAFASMYPELADPQGNSDTETYGGGNNGVTIWNEYVDRVQSDVHIVVGENLRASGLLNQDTLTVDRPVSDSYSWGCTPSATQICMITVTVHYQLHTFTSDVSLPGVGRLGLPNYYLLGYTYKMAIR